LIGAGTGLHRIAGGQALRRDDVATLAVGEQHQGNVRRAVGIVLDTLNAGRNAILVALEIDQPVMLLVPAANVTRGDTAVVVATTVTRLLLQQGSVGRTAVQLAVHDAHLVTAPGGGRLALCYCHLFSSPYSRYSADAKSMS
jgi:hypothetical protein